MAEYIDVIKHFKRMCKSTTAFRCSRSECPVMGHEFGCENIGQCRKIAFEQPDVFEEKVMSWAAANPEPVYPTWIEWFKQQNIWRKETDNPAINLYNPIPADIAEKIGIKPKEDMP